jgi:hypothetical protein
MDVGEGMAEMSGSTGSVGSMTPLLPSLHRLRSARQQAARGKEARCTNTISYLS